MARTRSIKPQFFDNDTLAALPPLTRLLFIGLWCHADREGRLEDRPRKIRKVILGFDDVTADDVGRMLQALHDAGFILRYSAAGEAYIQIVTFKKHQFPHHRESPSEIPPPSGEPASPRQALGQPEASPRPALGQPEESPGLARPLLPLLPLLPLKPLTVPTPRREAGVISENAPINERPKADEAKSQNKAATAVVKLFDEFWAAYPKKAGKRDALQAWTKLGPDAALAAEIASGVERWRQSKQWQKEGGQYIPNPATFLRGERWRDECTAAAHSATKNYDVGEDFVEFLQKEATK